MSDPEAGAHLDPVAEHEPISERYVDIDVVALLRNLIEVAEDGRRGFAETAAKLSEDGHHQLASEFSRTSRERGAVADAIRALSPEFTEHTAEGGSLLGALHRGVVAIKDAVNGHEVAGLLRSAEHGEDHAVAEWEAALESDVLPRHARTLVEQQLVAVRESRAHIRTLADTSTA